MMLIMNTQKLLTKFNIMKTLIKINSIFGKLIFEYECENNTIKKTVEEAVKEKIKLSFADLRSANLRYADLRSANLRYADLRYADLRSANLRYADLSYADLRSANLRYANLRSADLSYADLSYADLRSANLRSADLSSADLRFADLLHSALNKETAWIPIFCKWSHSIIGDNIKIGCKTQSIIEWDIFFKSTEEYSTKRNTQDFKQIEAVYLAYKAYLTHLKNN